MRWISAEMNMLTTYATKFDIIYPFIYPILFTAHLPIFEPHLIPSHTRVYVFVIHLYIRACTHVPMRAQVVYEDLDYEDMTLKELESVLWAHKLPYQRRRNIDKAAKRIGQTMYLSYIKAPRTVPTSQQTGQQLLQLVQQVQQQPLTKTSSNSESQQSGFSSGSSSSATSSSSSSSSSSSAQPSEGISEGDSSVAPDFRLPALDAKHPPVVLSAAAAAGVTAASSSTTTTTATTTTQPASSTSGYESASTAATIDTRGTAVGTDKSPMKRKRGHAEKSDEHLELPSAIANAALVAPADSIGGLLSGRTSRETSRSFESSMDSAEGAVGGNGKTKKISLDESEGQQLAAAVGSPSRVALREASDPSRKSISNSSIKISGSGSHEGSSHQQAICLDSDSSGADRKKNLSTTTSSSSSSSSSSSHSSPSSSDDVVFIGVARSPSTKMPGGSQRGSTCSLSPSKCLRRGPR